MTPAGLDRIPGRSERLSGRSELRVSGDNAVEAAPAWAGAATSALGPTVVVVVVAGAPVLRRRRRG